MADQKGAKARLEASLIELEERLTNISRDLSEPSAKDWEDLATEREDAESLEHQAGLVAQEIASVQRALLRIKESVYGLCVRCGQAIAPERLQARPEAALCIDCARDVATRT